MGLHDHFQLYPNPGLTPVPLRFRSEELLVRWGNGWDPAREELDKWFLTTKRNGDVRCSEHLAVIYCASDVPFRNFATSYHLPSGYPVVKTGRGYDIWVKPKKSIKSPYVTYVNGVGIKCLGSYVIAPPSIYLSGVPYVFEIASSGGQPEIDSDTLLRLPTDSAKCQVQQIYATTWLGSHSLLWCGKVELMRAGKDG